MYWLGFHSLHTYFHRYYRRSRLFQTSYPCGLRNIYRFPRFLHAVTQSFHVISSTRWPVTSRISLSLNTPYESWVFQNPLPHKNSNCHSNYDYMCVFFINILFKTSLFITRPFWRITFLFSWVFSPVRIKCHNKKIDITKQSRTILFQTSFYFVVLFLDLGWHLSLSDVAVGFSIFS